MVGYNSVQYQAQQADLVNHQTGAGRRKGSKFKGFKTGRSRSGYTPYRRPQPPPTPKKPKPSTKPKPKPPTKPKPPAKRKPSEDGGGSGGSKKPKLKEADGKVNLDKGKSKGKSDIYSLIGKVAGGKSKKGKDGEKDVPLTKKEMAKKYGGKVLKQVGKEALSTGANLAAGYLEHRLLGGEPVTLQDATEAAGAAGLDMVDSALQGKPLKGAVSNAMNTAAHKQMKKVGARANRRGQADDLVGRVTMMENYLAEQRDRRKSRKKRNEWGEGVNRRNIRGYQGKSYEGYDYGLGRGKKTRKGKGKNKKKSGKKTGKRSGKKTSKEMDVNSAVKRRLDFLDVFTAK